MKKIVLLLFILISFQSKAFVHVLYNGHTGTFIGDGIIGDGIINIKSNNDSISNVTVLYGGTLETDTVDNGNINDMWVGYNAKVICPSVLADGITLFNGKALPLTGTIWSFQPAYTVDLRGYTTMTNTVYCGQHTATGSEDNTFFSNRKITVIDTTGGYVSISNGNIRLYNGVTFPVRNAIAYSDNNGDFQFTAAGGVNEVLHGYPNHSGGVPTFSAVDLANDVTGILPFGSVASLGSMAKCDSTPFLHKADTLSTLATKSDLQQFPRIIYQLDSINVGGNIVDLPISGTETASTFGVYRISVYMETNLISGSPAVVVPYVTFNGAGSTPVINLGGVDLTGANNNLSNGGVTAVSFVHYPPHGTDPATFSVLVDTDYFGGGTYNVHVTVEQFRQF